VVCGEGAPSRVLWSREGGAHKTKKSSFRRINLVDIPYSERKRERKRERVTVRVRGFAPPSRDSFRVGRVG